MRFELYKVGNNVDHLSIYDITQTELMVLKKAVIQMETSNSTKPKDRDIISEINRGLRDCSVFEIKEDSDNGIE